ncbi:ABC transporter ATP-binding protein [Corynebacterium pseudotuberculosis]|uniref:ATP-binding cassette domain-containing protein n=1 Tax=Corynebacterium pseudotuberculosis 258 TaxID=1168865 RepID=A0AAU8PK45_CORPS|nr:ABC transporter ATP-binding protein [Corynebacterium pseudotuberculosis]AER69145.1 Nod factor export ATP-binding protein I [Corynebacterium pseudotuberculosis 1/06-A]AEQ06648.1 ATP-binding cassette domain-containing protein [Corynebacterium pseudotuberculosis CIP 52.97]AFK16742.1 ATP-binding cassette domain-containing protein [Corynebacterium pseudotuberculosis 258]AKS13436.1 Nod factor export ATP-binding protein I [Corynebacterium pseudotuberculosis]AMN70055.1 ATP-binding cassette domain-c
MTTFNSTPSEPTTSPIPVLELTHVVKRFGAKEAVAGLSLRAYSGQVLAFLGPNGAGKTTTIEMCEGFQKPTSGTIRVLGIDPTKHPDAVRQKVGIMLQGGGSYSGIRVQEMLNLTASYSKDPLDTDWLLQVLGLDSHRTTTYRRLSGGQKQRLSLALALVGRPQLVFLDEPTAGMDAQSRLVVWKLIRSLKADDVTVILTTHLMDEAQALADRVAIIDQGRLIAEGTTEELRASKKSGTSAVFSTSTALPLSSGFLEGIAVREIKPLHYGITGELSPDILARLSTAAAQENVLITSWETKTKSLEDIFLDLTGRELRS